ncbi:MAG: hypothetical protein J5I47_13155 [Vicingus serpentipes]|nr:hypothetical protein [Vicingus serpentipes]
MRKIAFILCFFIPSLFFGQSSRDINIVIQKTIDLHALKGHYTEEEQSGETPLLIINDDKIPNNLIVFKFNKRVKVMTHVEITTFKNIYKGNLDSYFVFEVIDFAENNNEVSVKATFRKENPIIIHVSMKKEDNDWKIVASKAD